MSDTDRLQSHHKLADYLYNIGACSDARVWVDDHVYDLRTAWEHARDDWRRWLLRHSILPCTCLDEYAEGVEDHCAQSRLDAMTSDQVRDTYRDDIACIAYYTGM